MGNVRVAHYLASFHKNVIFVKTRHCFIYPPSVAEMSFLGIPKKLLQMMVNLKSAKRILNASTEGRGAEASRCLRQQTQSSRMYTEVHS